MTQFAKRTKVPADQSRNEIERTLLKYGASKFAFMSEELSSTIAFEAHSRRFRFILPFPEKSRKSQERWSQEVRQRWRALVLTIKAKLESVETGIATFEDEFLPYTVLPNNQTVSEYLQPQILAAYQNGKMPLMLTDGQ